MKKCYFVLFLLFFNCITFCQNLVQLEYFIDNDAGFGNNTIISVTPSANGEINFTPTLNGISPGQHLLYTRIKDNNGRWSHTTRRIITVYATASIPQLSQLEYFIDTDAGIGNNTIVSFSSTPNGELSFTANLNGIIPGRHFLYTRVKDSNGRWGHTTRRGIEVYENIINNTIVGIEYFFDTDPGYQSATYQTFATVAPDGSFQLTIPQDNVQPGNRQLYMRIKDNPNNKWSHTAYTTKDFQLVNCAVPTQPAVITNDVKCSGSIVTYTIPAVTGATSYNWQVPSGVSITTGQGTRTVTVQLPTVNTSTSFNLSVAATNECGASIPRTFAITVNAPTTPSLSINTSQTTVCAGSNVVFTASATNSGSSPFYQWKLNGVNVGTNNNSYSNNTLINGDIITCVLTSSGTCTTTPTVTSNSLTMTVNAIANPTINISASQNNICQGTTIQFSAVATNAGNNPSYQWKKNGSNVGSNSTSYNDASLNNGDIITCVVTSSVATGCQASTTATSNGIIMNITTAASPIVTIAGTTVIAQGAVVLLSAAVTNGGTNPGYQWQDSTETHNWQNIAGATNNSLNYKPEKTGDKIRCLIISNVSCISSAGATSNVLVFSVETNSSFTGGGIRCYPNPTSSILILDSLKLDDRWREAEIVEMCGRSIVPRINIANRTSITIPVSWLPRGIYFIRLRKDLGKPFHLKFIKN